MVYTTRKKFPLRGGESVPSVAHAVEESSVAVEQGASVWELSREAPVDDSALDGSSSGGGGLDDFGERAYERVGDTRVG